MLSVIESIPLKIGEIYFTALPITAVVGLLSSFKLFQGNKSSHVGLAGPPEGCVCVRGRKSGFALGSFKSSTIYFISVDHQYIYELS